MTFYKGYHAYLTAEDLAVRETGVEAGESGMLKVRVPAGEDVKVVIKYEQPKIFYVSAIVSLISMVMLFFTYRKFR